MPTIRNTALPPISIPTTSRRPLQAAEGLEAGGIGVNVNNVVDLQAPFGGWKQSGLGRELGHYGLEAYLETKHIRLGL